MGEPYLKQWLNTTVCLSKEIKDIPSDFRNGYFFGEILYKHRLIPNFHQYKNTSKYNDISKNYQYLSKAFEDLNIKFNDNRRNDILKKKEGVASQIIFKLKQVIDQKLLSKENLKMQKGPNELHKLYNQMMFPNDNKKYFQDYLSRKIMKNKNKTLNPITQYLSKEGQYYIDIGKEIKKDQLYLDAKAKTLYQNIHATEVQRGKFCLEKDEQGLDSWKKQMEIKKNFEKKQLEEKWEETEFYKTATLNSFKRSNKSNINEISKFNQNLSRLGLDVKDQNQNNDKADSKKNYMSPQIILKMYRDKIAEQEKSRKDKEKRLRKRRREEDKMIEFSKNNGKSKPSKAKRILIDAKDKNKEQFSQEPKFLTLKQMEKKCLIDDYDKKKKDYENVLYIHRKEKILDLAKREENEEEKITLPYRSMYDFFDKKLFFMRLDKLNTGYFKKKIENRTLKNEKNIPSIKDIFYKILEIAEESDNYLQEHNCELIEIPQWDNWMQLLKSNVSLSEYLGEKKDADKIEKTSVELLYENEDEENMVKFKNNEFFDYLNFFGNWEFNIKQKILDTKNNDISKISESDKKNTLNNFFKNLSSNNTSKIEENPLELSLYKILGQDIAFMLNAGKCEISGLKENVLLKMKNKEFEPGTQDINNITLPIKYNRMGHVGEIIEFFINMKYDKKEKEINNNNNIFNKINLLNNDDIKEQKNNDNDIIQEETKKEIEPSEDQSMIKQQEVNIENNDINRDNNNDNKNEIIQNNPLLQSNDEFIDHQILEEIKENEIKYSFDHIPIKLCLIGTSFSGRKTQSLLLHEKYPNIKIYNLEELIKSIVELYIKINTPIEELQAKSKQAKKNNNIEQIKQENENLQKENAFQLTIINPVMKKIENNNDIKKIMNEISDENLINLLLFYIKKDFPLKEKSKIEEEITQKREALSKKEKELEDMTVTEEQNKKAKVNVKEKEKLIKEKEQIINDSYIGFIINDFPKTLEQYKLFENKCTGFVEELDKQKEEKDIEKEDLLYSLNKIYYPKNKAENIKSVFDRYCIFDVSDEEILKRKNGRLLDETTGIIYHSEYNPPDEKDKKLIERLKPLTEPKDEEILEEIKKYYMDLINIKGFIELFKNVYQVPDLKDKNEENQNIVNNVLSSIIEEFDNKYLNLNDNKKPVVSGEIKKQTNPSEKNSGNNENKEENKKENNELTSNENNVSNVNSIKNASTHNNGLERKLSMGILSSKNNRNVFILPVMITPLNKFNKRYNEAKKRLSLSNLDIHFLNKWNQFYSDYKFSILRNFVNIHNIKQLIQNETIKVEEEYIQFLNLPSNKKEIIDRFTTKLSAFRHQFKDIKSHKLVLEEFHRDLTDLTNGIWDIINQRKQNAINKREEIMNNGFFEKQIKHFHDNIENLFVQETKKFLLSVNIIKEFYYGLQSEILKSVILPFTSQLEKIDINNIFTDTENLELISNKNINNNINNIIGFDQLKFPKLEKMFYNCMKIIFYIDYAIRNVEDKLKGNYEDIKTGNKEPNNSGTLSMVSKSRLTKKRRKKNKDNSLSEDSKEIFNFFEETSSAIEIEKTNYKYRLLCIKFYSIDFLTNLNNISTELFDLLDTWIIDTVHYQNQMMNKLLERLSKIVDNPSLKIIWDFELDKFSLMKTKQFEFPEPYNLFLEDDTENENKEIKYGKYIPLLISLYNDINNFSLQNEFIDKSVFIDILFKKDISSLELNNTPLYKVNFHMYQKMLDLMTINNKNFIRKEVLNINHIFTILLLLPFPVVKEKYIEEMKDKVKDKLISKCYLKDNDFKELNLWFEGNNILKIADDADNGNNGNNKLNLVKNFLSLLFNKNGNINFEDFLNVVSLNIIAENNENFEKNKFKFYKDLFF